MKHILLILFLITSALVIRHATLPEPEVFQEFIPPVEQNITDPLSEYQVKDPFAEYGIREFSDINASDINITNIVLNSKLVLDKKSKHQKRPSNSNKAIKTEKVVKIKKKTKKKTSKKHQLATYRYEGSSKLNKMSITNVEANAIIKKAKRYLGVKYVYGGHTFRGLDCSAFTQKIYGSFRINLPRVACKQFTKGKIIKKSQAKAGDLIFFSSKRKNIGHVGIILDPKKKLFIHASSGAKKVTISNYEKKYYKKRFKGVRRVL
jgi:cell wall-associated NlpC family hydrolase